MPPADALDIARTAISVLLKIGAPLMLTALIVGLVVSFFQALTQIQEMTLSFIPKILALFGVLLLLIPYISSTLATFTHQLFDQVARLGS